ncbi:MAG: tRNA (adenine-N1)-methyltransferase [Chloroflexi bacterium]|nr:MAG: tRNA (adenine-N1)-methyltransferase [Chloroflexota bacterium]
MKPIVLQPDDTVLLISQDGKKFYIRLQPGHRQHTHQGIIDHNDLIGQPPGRRLTSTTGHTFLAVEPSLDELMKEVRRKSQIIYPKEAGRIILKLNIYAGRRVIEAGSGSGALTVVLARLVAPTGRVYSYEVRPDMLANAQANVERAGLEPFVEFKLRDIAAGFDETNVDAVFLDVRQPDDYLAQVKAALKPGGFFGAIVPTTNQVSALLKALRAHDFGGAEVEENFLRTYKPVPNRLRPADLMVGHTGYLVFARNIHPDDFPETPLRGAARSRALREAKPVDDEHGD